MFILVSLLVVCAQQRVLDSLVVDKFAFHDT